MSKQQQETPAWHAIVGDDWEPVLFGEETEQHNSVLESQGWVESCDGGGFIYASDMKPRRRRRRSYDVLTMKRGVTYCRIKAAKPGDRFMLTEDGELVPIEVDE